MANITRMYFKMTHPEYPDQWIIGMFDVTPVFSVENFCRNQNAVEITITEYNKLSRQFKKTGKMLKAESN